MPRKPQTEPIGARVKAARKQRNLTLEQTAKIIGVSFTTISRIEHGHNHPSRKVLDQLHKIGVQVEDSDYDGYSKDSIERRLQSLEGQVALLIDEYGPRIEALEDTGPDRARQLLIEAVHKYGREEVMEWVATAQEESTQASRVPAKKQAGRQRQPA